MTDRVDSKLRSCADVIEFLADQEEELERAVQKIENSLDHGSKYRLEIRKEDEGINTAIPSDDIDPESESIILGIVNQRLNFIRSAISALESGVEIDEEVFRETGFEVEGHQQFKFDR